MKNITVLEDIRHIKLPVAANYYFVSEAGKFLFCREFVGYWFGVPAELTKRMILRASYSTQPFAGARALKFSLDDWGSPVLMPSAMQAMREEVGTYVFSHVRNIVGALMGDKPTTRLYVKLEITGVVE